MDSVKTSSSSVTDLVLYLNFYALKLRLVNFPKIQILDNTNVEPPKVLENQALKKLICRKFRFSVKLEPIPFGQNIEIQLFCICVGVWVGGHPTTKFSYESKDALERLKKSRTRFRPFSPC